MLLANALRTSARRGSSSLLIYGMAAYAISKPGGNWETNSPGRFFWREF
jgi:hypothetical protein